MEFLDNIRNNNQFPIIFIGSVITKRYFVDAPDWQELLEKIWSEVADLDKMYDEIYQLRKNFGKNDSFDVNVNIATKLQELYDDAFFKKKVKLDNLTLKQATEKGIDPFKQRIANAFNSLEKRSEFKEEIEWFSKMLVKARMVITTNYDTFIEEEYNAANTSVQVHIGNQGLFEKTADYGELYKIHGSITDVNTISITKEDYEGNEKRSALIDAKILSNLTESPIIFLGYSLTDRNVRRILNSFVENAPFDISQAASRIGVVEYAAGLQDFDEAIEGMANNQIHYTSIRTDNYLEIYKKLSKIDQSYTPAEIRKYESSFRRIIEVKGQEKQLKNVLVDYADIDKLTDGEIKNKNIVVAFGNDKIIYRWPTFAEYLRSYFLGDDNFTTPIALKFISEQPLATPVPIKKYLKDIDKKHQSNRQYKVKAKIEKVWTFYLRKLS